MNPNFLAVVSAIVKLQKEPKYPSTKGMGKDDMAYTYNGMKFGNAEK